MPLSPAPARPIDPGQARIRLIDHFKRAYQIVVGLAITNACGRVFLDTHDTLLPADFSGPQVWMFAAFLVTVVPIFQGGDRSLDIKYYGVPPLTAGQRVSYVLDVYLLLVTAIFFVKIAQALPKVDAAAPPPEPVARQFYVWMGYLLVFDIVVLLLDTAKSSRLKLNGAAERRAYRVWMPCNAGLATLCGWIAWTGTADRPWSAVAVFAAALIRTGIDYWFGADFLFP